MALGAGDGSKATVLAHARRVRRERSAPMSRRAISSGAVCTAPTVLRETTFSAVSKEPASGLTCTAPLSRVHTAPHAMPGGGVT